jgi:sugar/nucleoside kinase (ribokinase family)
MNTFPGASHHLGIESLDEAQIGGASILYLEGYLWVPEAPRAAMEQAIRIARAAGRKVALTLSDIACIATRRDAFRRLIDEGLIDILFANEQEIKSLAGELDIGTSLAAVEDKVPLVVVTCSEKGAIAIEHGRRVQVPAQRVEKVVDTTGAGDLFAAGCLFGQARGYSLEESLRIGSIAAAEIISHFGARPETDLKTLVQA